MTVEPYEPFLLQITRNPLGLTDLPVYVDARPHGWMLDPTAPFNLISRSEAKEAGLKVSEESATIRSLTGRPMPDAHDRDSPLHHRRPHHLPQHDRLCL